MQEEPKNRTLKPHLPRNFNAFFGGSHGGSVKWQGYCQDVLRMRHYIEDLEDELVVVMEGQEYR